MTHLEESIKRRDFVRLSGLAAAAGLVPATRTEALLGITQTPDELPPLSPENAATDEAFWRQVRALYTPSAEFLDFDNANTGAVPASVVATYVRHVRDLNGAPNVHFPRLSSSTAVYEQLATFLDATIDEIALVPNATTGLNTILRGFPLAAGDEVLVTSHEYPDMVATLGLRARREGIVVRTVPVPDASEDPLQLAARVEQAVTPRTKLMLVSHVSAWTAEVLPVAELCAAAKSGGIAVVVDAAQSVGYLDVKFRAWGCDFVGMSLHKGLGAPIASGVLLVRKDWFGRVEPLHPPTWDISKYPIEQYAWTGTPNVAASAAIPEAIAVQQRIGLARKRARLRYLASYWQERVRNLRGVKILTPGTPARSFGFSSFAIDGIPSREVEERMRRQHKILVQDKASRPFRPVDNAVRVSPQPYTTPQELDRLVAAIAEIAGGRS